MATKSNVALLFRLVAGIVAGIVIGYIHNEVLVRSFLTFNAIFGQFLSFVVPILVLAFVTSGIAELGKNAGKLLVYTVLLAFASTIVVGITVFFAGEAFLGSIISHTALVEVVRPDSQIVAYISPNFPPVMGVISALILAFILGAGIAFTGATTLASAFKEFQAIIQKIIAHIIIPLLPFYIAGVFANITYSGQVATVMKTFAGVFALVICLHIIILIALYTIAGLVAKRNPFVLLKNMLPAYFTALGTQSSAATIPVTIESMRANGVRERTADFVAPLCANIHMSGSMTTLTICSMSVMMLTNMDISFGLMAQFIVALAFAMVAAPGVPGGSVFAALPFLASILGFNETLQALMIALYLTQDSFGTACNVTGDGAIAVIVDSRQQDA